MNNSRFHFKAYVKEYDEVCDVLYIDFVNNYFAVTPFAELEGGNQVQVFGLEKLMQYTGINDIDGNEIYGGYIVEYIHSFREHKYNCYVKYMISEYNLYILNTNIPLIKLSEELIKKFNVKIIGNIYQKLEK